jgi:hypothetical protein
LLGSVAGLVTPLDKMSAKYKLALTDEHGRQDPEGLISGTRLAPSLRSPTGEQSVGLKTKLSLLGKSRSS